MLDAIRSEELRPEARDLLAELGSAGLTPIAAAEQLAYLVYLARLPKRGIRVPPKFDWAYLRSQSPEISLAALRGDGYRALASSLPHRDGFTDTLDDAVFALGTARLLKAAIKGIERLGLATEPPERAGPAWEAILTEAAISGVGGQFRTPRYIVEALVQLAAPPPGALICDPAAGTGGVLIAASRSDRNGRPPQRWRRDGGHVSGFDVDPTMVRLGVVNLLVHGIEPPRLEVRDSLAPDFGHRNEAAFVITAPPFGPHRVVDGVATDLSVGAAAKRSEVLFLELGLRLAERSGGRVVTVVPDSLLASSSRPLTRAREELLSEHRVDAVVSLPVNAFRPYSRVATAIMSVTTGRPTTDVRFARLTEGGFLQGLGGVPAGHQALSEVIGWARGADVPSHELEHAAMTTIEISTILDNGARLSPSFYLPPDEEAAPPDDPLAIIAELRDLDSGVLAAMAQVEQFVASLGVT